MCTAQSGPDGARLGVYIPRTSLCRRYPYLTVPPPPFVILHPLQPPPPPPMGGASLGPKSIGDTKRRRKKFLGYTGTGVGGDRHLVTVPCPHWGDRPDIRGGVMTRGGGG